MKTKYLLLLALCLAFQEVTFSQTFQDNFNEDTLGNRPTNWQTVRGEGVVANVDGRNVVDLSNNSIIMPMVNGQNNDYLSDQFVFEFDAYFDKVPSLFWQRYELRFWEGVSSYNQGNIAMQAIQVHSHGAKTTLKMPAYKTPKKYVESLKTMDSVWRHIKVVYIQGAFKLYIDEELILDFPQLPFEPKMISIGAVKYEPSLALIGGITNVSISENEQIIEADSNCGALPTDEQLRVLIDPNSMFNQRLKFLEDYTIEDLRGVPTVPYINGQFVMPQQVRFTTSPTENFTIIPLAVHIVRQTNHEGGITLGELYKNIKKANSMFEDYGVYLHLEKVQFIDNDEKYNTTYIYGDKDDEEVDIFNMASTNISEKLNIYYVPYTKGVNGGIYSWSKYPDKSVRKQHILMNNGHGGAILVHEIGHWFNLLHTHETKNGMEYVNGTNCATAGDLCCDTPADPKLSGKVDEKCNYTGTDTDASNNSYNPDVSNIMSYTKSICRTSFSDQQVKRMYNAYVGMEQDRGYTFKVNTGIGENIQTLSLNPGWKAVEHFSSGNKVFMVFFNDQTNEIAINQLNKDGTRGLRVSYKDFRGHWSTIKVFKYGLKQFLLMINYNSGELAIVKLNQDGTMGSGQSYHINTGWSNAIIENVGKETYLALFRYDNGKVVTYKLMSEGRLGEKTYENPSQIFYKYDIIEVFGEHIICYNSQTGKAIKATISDSGRFQTFFGQPNFLGKNWSALKYVSEINNQGQSINSILILNKTTGQIKQYYWNESKTIGDNWYDSAKVKGNLPTGFDVVTPYTVFDGNRYQGYVMISNSTTGKILTYHLN